MDGGGGRWWEGRAEDPYNFSTPLLNGVWDGVEDEDEWNMQ